MKIQFVATIGDKYYNTVFYPEVGPRGNRYLC